MALLERQLLKNLEAFNFMAQTAEINRYAVIASAGADAPAPQSGI